MTRHPMIDRRMFIGGTAAAVSLLGLPLSFPAFGAPVAQMTAFQIFDGMGTRAKPNDSRYRNDRWQPLIADDLGFRHTRGSIGHNKSDVPFMKYLFDRGVKHCATIVDIANGLSWPTAQANINGIRDIWGPQNIFGIEGANEFNDSKYAGWNTDLRNFTKQTHDYVRSISALNSVKLVPPSVYRRIHEDYVAIGDLSLWTDVGCGHYYSGSKRPTLTANGTSTITTDQALADMAILNPKPPVITEMGVDLTLVAGPKTQAKYLLRMHIELLRRGAFRTYGFETFDTMTGHKYGLMDASFNKRPAYFGMKNLLALVRDVPSAPRSLAYQLAGPSDIQRLVVSRSDGSFLLFLWRDLNSTENDAAPVNANITLAKQPAGLELLTPTYSAIAKPLPAQSSFGVAVSDHLTVVRIIP